MEMNIDAVTVGLVAFIGGIGNRLAGELIDYIKKNRYKAKAALTRKNGK